MPSARSLAVIWYYYHNIPKLTKLKSNEGWLVYSLGKSWRVKFMGISAMFPEPIAVTVLVTKFLKNLTSNI